jgi:hypothetical protein
MKDSPQRTAAPEFGPETRDFNDLPLREKLDLASDAALKNLVYRMAADEALPMSEQYETWMRQVMDATVTDADVGRAAREIVCAYVAEVAGHRGESL